MRGSRLGRFRQGRLREVEQEIVDFADIGDAIDYRLPIRPHHHRFRSGSRVRVRLGGGPPSKLTAPAEPVTASLDPGAAAVC